MPPISPRKTPKRAIKKSADAKPVSRRKPSTKEGLTIKPKRAGAGSDKPRRASSPRSTSFARKSDGPVKRGRPVRDVDAKRSPKFESHARRARSISLIKKSEGMVKRERPVRDVDAKRPSFRLRPSSDSKPSFRPRSSSNDKPAFRSRTSSGTKPSFRPRGSSDERPSFRPRTSSSARPAFKPRTSSDARPFPSKPQLKITVAPAKLVKKISKKAKIEAEEIKNAPPIELSGKIRLNKFIANAGITSRRKADELITKGVVTVNGKVVTELGVQVKAYEDLVTVNGETISLRPRHIYLILNKPKDTISTTSDERDRTTVMDYVQTMGRVYPIGRLDRNTTGVLLLTNDGALTNRLTHPSFEIEREYHVTLDKRLDREDAKRIAEGGIDIGEGDVTGKAELAVAEDNPKDVVLLLREGKNREVRRIFETLGYEVDKLDRVSFAGITHRGMSRGESRPLSNPELHRLRRLAGIEE